MNPTQLIEPNINSKIFTIRGEQVMLDVHLAELYQVDTEPLTKQ